jgi:hypothetical protein
MKTQKTKKDALTITIEMGASEFGSPRPTLYVRTKDDAHSRKVAASLHRLAAAVIEATPDHEQWCVVVDVYAELAGRVYLETVTGEKAEADRAMAVLNNVAKAGL